MSNPVECFDRIFDHDFLTIMASRWPIWAVLDRINTKRLVLRATGDFSLPASLKLVPKHAGLGGLVYEDKADTSEGRNVEDCEIADHPTIDWNDFRARTRLGITEAIAALTSNRADFRENMDISMEHAGGNTWKSASRTNLDGQPVMHWTNLCTYGVAVSAGWRAFGALLSENDVFRGTERMFQQLENTVMRTIDRLIESKWRVFGLLHIISIVKRYRLDLPAPVIPEVDQTILKKIGTDGRFPLK